MQELKGECLADLYRVVPASFEVSVIVARAIAIYSENRGSQAGSDVTVAMLMRWTVDRIPRTNRHSVTV